MAKKFDPKAKAKKQKIIAIVGAVVLVAILGLTLPSTLKQLNPPRTDTAPSPVPSSTVVTPAAGTLAPPTLAGSGTPDACRHGGGRGRAHLDRCAGGSDDREARLLQPLREQGSVPAAGERRHPAARRLGVDRDDDTPTTSTTPTRPPAADSDAADAARRRRLSRRAP